MSTHITQCVICGKDCYCSSDAHALGCGGKYGEGGCQNPPAIEFCSLEHALELRRRIDAAIKNYHEVIAHDAPPTPPADENPGRPVHDGSWFGR